MRFKLFKRFASAATAALIFSSCSVNPSVEGEDLIKRAREEYKALDSARVVMTNTDTGEVEQTFVFKYDEKDVLMYSYEGKSESSEYAQFNNGVECFSYDNGEYSHVQKGDKDFNLYTRDVTHPQADEGLILFAPAAVTHAEVTEEDGITHITHIYDAEKIGAEAESGEVTGFSAEYFFSGEELQYFIETTDVRENGEDKRYSYKVEITEKNSVESIENTVEKYIDK